MAVSAIAVACFIAGLVIGSAVVVVAAWMWVESEEGRKAAALADAHRRIRDLEIEALRDLTTTVERFQTGGDHRGDVVDADVIDLPDRQDES